MKKFDWKAFKGGNIAVRCETEAEAKDFCKAMLEHGLFWSCWRGHYDEYTGWTEYSEDTCYYCDEYLTIRIYDLLADRGYNFTVLEWCDYMKFDWEAFKKEKIVVNCATREEANDFCTEMSKRGFRWHSGKSYLEDIQYNVYYEDTCYSGDGYFADIQCYEKDGATILKWGNYMDIDTNKCVNEEKETVEEFDWEAFETKKVAVHCATQKEANDFCLKLAKYRLNRERKNPLISCYRWWKWYKHHTCYAKDGWYGTVLSYKEKGYEIVEWRNYMIEDISKKDIQKKEMVDHPSHYNREGAMECIDEMVVIFGLQKTIDWCIMTSYKYRYRAGLKGSAEEDMKKSDWYLKKAKELQGESKQ